MKEQNCEKCKWSQWYEERNDMGHKQYDFDGCVLGHATVGHFPDGHCEDYEKEEKE
jgi:hypothetical protein